jgi:lycopene cyclase domain-containing protein
MTVALSYAAFHLLFVLPPIALLAAVLAVSGRVARPREALAGVVLLATIATVYTTPWDNYLIARGVWTYGEGTVLARVWRAPIEEYAFFVLQPVLAGLWFHWLDYTPDPDSPIGRRTRIVGAAVWVGVAAGGAWLLSVPGGLYLGAIAAWAAPIAALQWALGGPVLWRNRRLLALSIAVPTLYLGTIDRIALSLGIWRLSPAHTTGISLLGLPVEEAAFFLVTTALVVQGLLLFHWVLARVRAGGPAYGLSGLLPTERVRGRAPERSASPGEASESVGATGTDGASGAERGGRRDA